MVLGQAGGEAVIVAGIGSRKGVSAAEVIAAVEAALKEHGLTRPALSMLATARMKQDEAGIIAAGGALNCPLILVDGEVLKRNVRQDAQPFRRVALRRPARRPCRRRPHLRRRAMARGWRGRASRSGP